MHHDNATACTSRGVKQFLVSKQITTLNNASYSPDLAPWGFFLFVKLKEIIKGTRFEGVDDIETNVTAYIKSMEKKEFEECFRAGVGNLSLAAGQN